MRASYQYRLPWASTEMITFSGLLSRTWMATGKPAYLFVTRRLLGWSDREGAGDRGF